VKLPSREEVLAAVLLVDRRGLSVTPSGLRSPVVYRYETNADADNHLSGERACLESR
jgi:hypothetical protein